MKSGMLAAETISRRFSGTTVPPDLQGYEERFRKSWAYEELYNARNFRQAFEKGLYNGLLQAGMQFTIPGLSLATGFLKKAPSGNRRKKALRSSSHAFQA